MAVWETEDEDGGPPTAASLPTPQETPYRTPSRGSRRSRRSATPPVKGPSPPPSDKRSSKDITTDESISILDPRRFTPTLHANLVAEILSLRRDQEEKIKLIETLEDSLQTSREGEETLKGTLSSTTKESRSLKRQLALLEGGTSSALGELSRERDEAVESVADLKKRLEVAQKKVRVQEDDSERVHDLWAKEKDEWEDEKRKFERRIHVTETRLKSVLEEVAAYHDAQTDGAPGGVAPESETEELHKDNDAASVRSMSMTNSVRFSVMSGHQAAKMNGNSLADELNFDGDDDWHTDNEGRESVLSNHHIRKMSRDSMISRMHRRNQSIESLKRPGSVARGKLWANQAVLETLEDGVKEETEMPPSPTKPTYTDTGIQYSPPPSPKMQPSEPSTPEPGMRVDRVLDMDSPSRGSPRADAEIEANQRRKRVHHGRPLNVDPFKVARPMVSASAQTIEEPPSPPKTPKSPPRSMTPPPAPVPELPSTVSSSTQTDPPPLPRPESFPVPEIPIPSISIVPPTSRPTTPREPRLPQYFKDFGCQVNLPPSTETASVSVQTEEIRIDKRIALLPEHLRPSHITSRPGTPSSAVDDGRDFSPVPGNLPPRNPRRLAGKRTVLELPPSPPPGPGPDEASHDAYPGNNDDGPLSTHRAPVKRPHRISSLFAGFDGGSSDEADEFGDADVSDSEYRTALSAPRPKGTAASGTSKRNSSGTAGSMSPEQFAYPKRISSRGSARPLGGEVYSSYNLPEARETLARGPSLKRSMLSHEKPTMVGTATKVNVMRRAAMIQSGIASHQGRARSPSLNEARDPPFPIPTRASSRRPPLSASAPSDGQRSPTRQDPGWNRGGMGRSQYRAPSVRKVRSAAAIPVKPRNRRQGSRSPPPFSPSTDTPESPGLPPLPDNDITTPRTRGSSSARYRTHQSQPSTNTAFTNNTNNTSNTNNTDVTSSSSQPLGVVDAIAQCMVGEWMFKYVRRRKSFGVPESGSRDENSNDRHKRWVWLAPYERAILWSSKQPSNNSTLMGKSGRKFTIQSVLDVKDDNSSPKGVAPLFNRSILILTPQRALKFTAVSAERHYVWLTALSFLAHSSQAIPEITTQPAPKPVPEFNDPPPQSKAKRAGIRDSIRLTKSRGNFAAKPPSIPPPIPSAPSSSIGEVSTQRSAEPFPSLPASHHRRDSSYDVAEAPYIPRFQDRNFQERGVQDRANNVMVHGRKRSNTGGHVPPPLSFRGFSGPAGGPGYHTTTNSVAGASVGTAGSSDIYQSQPSSNATWALSTTASQRTSEASSRPSNFFDAIGTVRMEAFISPLSYPRLDDYPDEQDEFRNYARRRSKELRRRNSRNRNRNRDSYNSRTTRTTDDWSRTDEDFFSRDDPFRGF